VSKETGAAIAESTSISLPALKPTTLFLNHPTSYNYTML
jgi:hypothetical protein